MISHVIMFIITFLRYFLATIEIKAIADARRTKATWFAVINEVFHFLTIFMVALDQRWTYVFPSMLGNALATNLALRIKDASKVRGHKT